MFASVKDSGETVLHSRTIDRIETTPIPGTEGAEAPFFSPDGRFVGFFADGKLNKVLLAGGPPTVVSDASAGRASWSEDDYIYFRAGLDEGISRVSADGGLPEELTTVDSERSEVTHLSPHVLPGGTAILFSRAGPQGRNVSVLSMESRERRVLIEDAGVAHYLPSGHLTFMRGQDLLAVGFDLERLEVVGSPFLVLKGVFKPTGIASGYYSVSRSGTLAYVPAGGHALGSTLVWVDRQGLVTPTNVPPGIYRWPRLSPDGRKVTLASQGPGNAHIWVHDLERGTHQRLTGQGGNIGPMWTPDGDEVLFASTSSGAWNFYTANADGGGEPRSLSSVIPSEEPFPNAMHPDGQLVAFENSDADSGYDLWTVDLREDTATPIVQTPYNESALRFSPDGRLFAYITDQSGRFEVYISALDAPERRTVVSTNGGKEAVWSKNGNELFYRNGRGLFAVPITAGPEIKVGEPVLLFSGPFETNPGGNPDYDVAADGRFMMIQRAASATPTEIHVVLNWAEELKRLASTEE